MNIFALDASGPCAGAALWQDGEITHEIEARHGLTHSQTLMPMADSIFEASGLSPRDIDLYACVTGPGSFRACANGDPTCLEPFQGPTMHAFNGKLTAIVQSSSAEAGKIFLHATSPGLQDEELIIRTRF